MTRSFLQKALLFVASLLAPAADAAAATCPDPVSFRAEVLRVLRRAFPEKEARPGPTEDEIAVEGATYSLGNLHRLVCAPPVSTRKERAKLIRAHFEKGFQSAEVFRRDPGDAEADLDWAAVRERLVIQLAREDLAAEHGLVRRPLVPGVVAVVVLDQPTAYTYVADSSREHLGVPTEELFDAAIQNLTRRTRGELRSSGEGEERVLMVVERDGYDAARILTPGLRKAAASLLGDPFRAAIPNRDFLVLWAAGNRELGAEAAARAANDFETQPYPLSPLILEVWADGRIAVVGPTPAGR